MKIILQLRTLPTTVIGERHERHLLAHTATASVVGKGEEFVILSCLTGFDEHFYPLTRREQDVRYWIGLVEQSSLSSDNVRLCKNNFFIMSIYPRTIRFLIK